MAKEDDIVQRVVIEGTQEAQRQLEDLGKSGEQSLDKLGKSSQRANEDLKKTDGAIKGVVSSKAEIKNLEKVWHDWGTSVRDVGAELLKTSKAVAIGLAAIGTSLFAIVKSAANAADALNDAAIAAGTSAQELSKLNFAAQQSGANAQSLTRAFAAISSAAGEAAKEGKSSSGAFEQFGIRLVNSAGQARDSAVVLKEVADVIASLPDAATKASAAATLFGRRIGPQLTQFLQQGSKGINELGKEAERLGLVLSQDDIKIGAKINDEFDKLIDVVGKARTAIGLALGPAVITLFSNLSEAIAASRKRFTDFGNSISQTLEPVFAALNATIAEGGTAFNWLDAVALGFKVIVTTITAVVIPAFQAFFAILNTIAAAINGVFGTNLNAQDLIILGIIAKLVSSFTLLIGVLKLATTTFVALRATLALLSFNPIVISITAFIAVLGLLAFALSQINWKGVSDGAAAAWTSIIQSATAFLEQLKASFNENVTAIGAFFSSLPDTVSAFLQQTYDGVLSFVTLIGDSIREGFLSAIDYVKGLWDGLLAKITEVAQPILDFLKQIVDGARSALNAIEGTTGGGTVAAARGGHIRGAGTSTSDSIPAWLSDGEFILNARAVRRYGVGFLRSLNSMRLGARGIRNSFASGGLVEGMNPRGAAIRLPAGFIGSEDNSNKGPRSTINLRIGDETFEGLSAPDDVADKLVRYAVKKNMKSAGRKASWNGGR